MTLHLKCSKTVLRFRHIIRFACLIYQLYASGLFYSGEIAEKTIREGTLARNYHSLTIYLQRRNKISDDIKQQAKLNVDFFSNKI